MSNNKQASRKRLFMGSARLSFALVLMCVIPLVGNAQKRLKSITYDGEEIGQIQYDNEGRISSISSNWDGDVENWEFSYYGSTINVSNEGQYTLNEADGVIVGFSATSYDWMVNYTYTDGYLSSYEAYSDYEYRQTDNIEWVDGNAVSFKENGYGKWTDATITYGDEQAHPIVHALFNFAPVVYGYPSIQDFVQDGMGFLYQYGGKTTKNLVSHISSTEYDDGDTYQYTYDFEYLRNADNDVVEVIITNKRGEKTTYELEWEDDPFSDVHGVKSDAAKTGKFFKLNGVQASQVQSKGLYVTNGRKLIVK